MTGKIILFLCFLWTCKAAMIRRSSGNPLMTGVCVYASHIGNLFSWNSCSEGRFQENYNRMLAADCRNCDKYFHCMANYEAVHLCSGSNKENTARIISDCRDNPSCTDSDCMNDRVANLYGRRGGDCATRYLCSHKCDYNPHDRTCKRSNCY